MLRRMTNYAAPLCARLTSQAELTLEKTVSGQSSGVVVGAPKQALIYSRLGLLEYIWMGYVLF